MLIVEEDFSCGMVVIGMVVIASVEIATVLGTAEKPDCPLVNVRLNTASYEYSLKIYFFALSMASVPPTPPPIPASIITKISAAARKKVGGGKPHILRLSRCPSFRPRTAISA